MDLMIDFETLGQNPDTVVLSLGACFFDLDKGEIGSTFYAVFEVQNQIDKGRSISFDTLKWWMSQDKDAQKVFKAESSSPEVVLNQFSKWVISNCTKSKVKPWGNGATFDISIIEDLFRQYGIDCPWMFYNVMDLRTLRRFLANNAKVQVAGTKHNALDDAKAQALFAIEHYQFYKKMLQTFAEMAKGADNADAGQTTTQS